jgi:three-Cys-motif partner protein
MYAQMFATGMKNRWDHRVYLDLFAGPGHSQIRNTRRTVLGSPLIALSLPDRFDRYVFADENPAAIEALRQRVLRIAPDADVRYIVGDANDRIGEITGGLPVHGPDGRVLSFCFLDPYKLNIEFETVRRLADGRPMDFLILLALHVDANRNIERYASEESAVIDRLLGDASWRPRWDAARARGTSVVEFLAVEYSDRMASLGYLPMALDRMVKIRTHDRRLPLYYLAFYSRNERGLDFWEKVLTWSDDQLTLL